MSILHPQSFNEDTLIISFKNGDEEALEYIYNCYADCVYGLIRKKISEDDVSSILLHKVFEQMWEQRFAYKKEYGTLFNCLASITRNIVLEHLINDPQKLSGTETNLETGSITLFNCSDINSVKRYLLRLPPKYRVVLDLFFVRGYSLTEISSLLKMDTSDTRKRLAKACEQLKLLTQDTVVA